MTKATVRVLRTWPLTLEYSNGQEVTQHVTESHPLANGSGRVIKLTPYSKPAFDAYAAALAPYKVVNFYDDGST